MIADNHLPNAFSREIAVILVDHGSRRKESNDLLLEVVEAYRHHGAWGIVEPAHMELAEPSIATAYASCVAQGARRIVVFPYFLSPGRHWHEDIPRLTASAAESWPGTSYLVTAPLGLHPLMLQVIDERITHCLAKASGSEQACSLCLPGGGCQLVGGNSPNDTASI